MNDAQDFIAFLDRVHDNAKGQNIVNLVRAQVLLLHLGVDAEEMLLPALDDGLDAGLSQFCSHDFNDFLDELLPNFPPLRELRLDPSVDLGLQVVQAEVLQGGLEPVDSHPAGKGRIDVDGFPGDFLLFFRRMEPEGLHVVEAVGEFDDDDTDIGGHGENHLAHVFRLLFLTGAELHLADLGHPVHDVCRFLSEKALHFGEFRGRVLDGIVKKAGCDTDHVHFHLGEDVCDFEGVGEIGFA